MSEIGQRLKALREERGLTQQQLAVKAELALVTVARLETRPQAPAPGGVNLSTLTKVARALGVPISALVDDTDEPRDHATAAQAT